MSEDAAQAVRDERMKAEGLGARILKRPELGAVAGFILVTVFFLLTADPAMFTFSGIVNFMTPAAQLGILAIGASLLMILTMSMATIPITAFGPLLVTVIHGVSALTAGYIVACSSIGWAVMAVLVSGLPERFDRLMIALGMAIVAISLLGFLYAVPGGPVWLIVVFAAMEGGGFGMAWTFILRRTIALADADEVQRVSGAIPTVQRLGYALGAAYVGIVANASGLLSMETAADAAKVARWVFVSCVPFAAIGLIAMSALVRDQKGKSQQ